MDARGGFDIGNMIRPDYGAAMARAEVYTDLPSSEESEDKIINLPKGGGAKAGAPAPASSSPCGQPKSMHKLTSGKFLGGLTMDSYYPHLKGRGEYGHPDTAGTFDTGTWVGANVQLYGVIPVTCPSKSFTLEQTVTHPRLRFNGVADPQEGKTIDDIANSGRDYSRPPRRQEFLRGPAAPFDYIISMADPPGVRRIRKGSIEIDSNFKTSLVGPGGRQSVTWSTSTRISNGRVIRNILS
jgi:hypothetical protein